MMNQTLEEPKEICDERTKVISNMIKMVLDKSMSWEMLEYLLDDIASSPSKSRQVIKILIHELKALSSKTLYEVIEKDPIQIDPLENKPIKAEDFKEEYQMTPNSSNSEIVSVEREGDLERNEKYIFEDSETEFTNDSFSAETVASDSNDKVAESLGKVPQKEESKIQNQNDSSQINMESEQNGENKYYVFIGDTNESRSINEGIVNNQTSKEKIPKNKTVFQCSICFKNLSRKDSLMEHERIHTGERPYNCKQCGKCFHQSGQLVLHKRLHTGINAYDCKICSKYFSAQSHLKVHERTHTGEKPFKCKLCPKSFSITAHPKSHERIHTGEKPFVCKSCSKSFNQATQLKTHGMTHSPNSQTNAACDFRPFAPIQSMHNLLALKLNRQRFEYANATSSISCRSTGDIAMHIMSSARVGQLLRQSSTPKLEVVSNSHIKSFIKTRYSKVEVTPPWRTPCKTGNQPDWV